RIGDGSTRELEVWRVKRELARHSRANEAVDVEVLRRGERKDFRLDLMPFDVPPLVRETVDGTPLLRPVHFESGVEEAWRSELEALRDAGAEELVVDLRGVAATRVEGAFPVADLFGQGTLGSLRRRGAVQERFESGLQPIWKGDLVVLVDRGTLGAAELLAKSLAGTVGAPLVGEPTYGWAGRRSRIELRSGALLQITDGFYAGPDGEVIDASLEPDYEIRDLWRRIGNRDREIHDLILERGLEVLRGETEESESRAA
ncbi:MAG: S41 family peptidase, partial [Thermoanaerobaculia bacterium]|nr:S41 family peptidase [Thermoanaerobaculia bacterium]